MEIRKASELDIDAIVELNRQIGEIHHQHYPEVFCPPSPEERAFLLDAIGAEGVCSALPSRMAGWWAF